MADLAYNRKVKFNYEIKETIEAGIELLGYEVKAVRAGKAHLDGAYAIIRGGEIFVMGVKIEPYQTKNTPLEYEDDRTRRLLLSKKEIRELVEAEKTSQLTLVPISMYNKGRTIKVSLALVKGKKKSDKRETIKRRETDRELRREFKAR